MMQIVVFCDTIRIKCITLPILISITLTPVDMTSAYDYLAHSYFYERNTCKDTTIFRGNSVRGKGIGGKGIGGNK